MSVTVRALSRVLPIVVCLMFVGCVQSSIKPMKNELITGSEGRSTVIDIKIDKYEQLVKEFPKEPRYHERLARLFWMKKDHRKALGHLDRARKLDPGNPKYDYFEGSVYYGIGNLRLAEVSYKNVIANAGEDFTGPYLRLAELSLVQEQEAEALAYLAKCTEIDPNFSTPYYYLGRIWMTRGDKKKTIECFESYLHAGGGIYQDEVLQTLNRLQPQVRLHQIR